MHPSTGCQQNFVVLLQPRVQQRHYDLRDPSEVCFRLPRIAARRIRRIICKKELWVPSARIGGRRPDGVSLGRFVKGVGGEELHCSESNC
jgi:hypothetical protein